MRKSMGAAMIAATMLTYGCGAAATTTPAARSAAATTAAAPALATTADDGPMVHDAVAEAGTDELPAAPWSAAPLTRGEVPGALLSAWADAENRASCAPIAPAALGAAHDADARVSAIVEGGWAVEFDRRGMPGMREDGESCARCGRGVFGVAGTSMSPDEVDGEGEVGRAIDRFADGSRVAMDLPVEGESVAAATITLGDQGCVYQVWSFLGEEHLLELVGGLRRVDVARSTTVAAR